MFAWNAMPGQVLLTSGIQLQACDQRFFVRSAC
jgi:hypothetical protein